MPRAEVSSRRRRRRIVAAVCVSAVVIAGASVLVAASDAAGPSAAGAAGAFVPRDGAVSAMTATGGVDQREDRIAAGIAALFVLPSSAQELATAAYGDGYEGMPHWVTYHSAAAGREGGLPREVSILTPEGIRVLAAVGYPTDSVYVPGMLVLPSDIAPGATWVSEGAAILAQPAADGAPGEGFVGRFDYSVDFAARTPEDPRLSDAVGPGCLETVSRATFTPESGGDALAIDQVALWCPGEGIAATVTSSAGSTVVDGPATPVIPAVDARPHRSAWDDPGAWAARDTSIRWADPLWGDTGYRAAPALPPVVVSSRLALADVNSGDVMLLEADAGSARVTAVLHPGGDVTTMTAAGEVLVLGTSRREVVAYSPDGIRLWTVHTADLTGALAATTSGVVIAGVDGSVSLRDTVTGDEQWRSAASAEALDRVIVVDDTVIVADRVGGVFAVSLDDGRERWAIDGDAETVALAGGEDVVFLAQGTGVRAVSSSTGATAWVASTSSGIDDVMLLADEVVVVGWGETTVLDAATGTRVRTDPVVDHAVTDGTHLLSVHGRTARLDGGATAREWEVPPEPLGAGRYLVSGGNEVWLVDSVTGVVRFAP